MVGHDDDWSDLVDVLFAFGVLVVVSLQDFVAGLELRLVDRPDLFVGQEDIQAFRVGVEGIQEHESADEVGWEFAAGYIEQGVHAKQFCSQWLGQIVAFLQLV